jgi:hypothetical protein
MAPVSVRFEDMQSGEVPRTTIVYEVFSPREMLILIGHYLETLNGRFSMCMLSETTVEVVVT